MKFIRARHRVAERPNACLSLAESCTSTDLCLHHHQNSEQSVTEEMHAPAPKPFGAQFGRRFRRPYPFSAQLWHFAFSWPSLALVLVLLLGIPSPGECFECFLLVREQNFRVGVWLGDRVTGLGALVVSLRCQVLVHSRQSLC